MTNNTQALLSIRNVIGNIRENTFDIIKAYPLPVFLLFCADFLFSYTRAANAPSYIITIITLPFLIISIYVSAILLKAAFDKITLKKTDSQGLKATPEIMRLFALQIRVSLILIAVILPFIAIGILLTYAIGSLLTAIIVASILYLICILLYYARITVANYLAYEGYDRPIRTAFKATKPYTIQFALFALKLIGIFIIVGIIMTLSAEVVDQILGSAISTFTGSPLELPIIEPVSSSILSVMFSIGIAKTAHQMAQIIEQDR